MLGLGGLHALLLTFWQKDVGLQESTESQLAVLAVFGYESGEGVGDGEDDGDGDGDGGKAQTPAIKANGTSHMTAILATTKRNLLWFVVSLQRCEPICFLSQMAGP